MNFTTAEGLGGNEIFDIQQDPFGRIWFLSYNGQNSYYEAGIFHNPTNTPFLESLVAKDYTRSLVIAPDSTLYFADQMGRIQVLDRENGIAEVYLPNQELINHMAVAPSGGFYVLGNKHLYILSSGRLNRAAVEWDYLPADTRCGSVQGKGLMIAKNGELDFLSDTGLVAIPFPKTPEQNQLAATFVKHLEGYGFWMGTENGVLQLPAIPGSGSGTWYLPDLSVSSVLADHEGNLWFTTLGHGVVFSFSREVLTYTTRDGLHSNQIKHLFPNSKDGGLILGFEGNTIQQLSATGDIRPSQKLQNRQAGTGRGRINSYLQTNTWDLIASDNLLAAKDHHGMLQSAPIGAKDLAIAPWDSTIVLIATNRGLFQCPIEAIEDYNLEQAVGVPHLDIPGVYALQPVKNVVYLATKSGLYCMDKNWEQVPLPDSVPALKERITDLALAQDGALWVATHGYGLIELSEAGARTISTADGLPSPLCRKLFIDEKQRCWVATNKGVARIGHGREGLWRIVTFNKRQGLPSGQINDVFVDGPTIWVATDLGLARFTEGYLRPNTVPPLLHIEGIDIDGKSQDLTQPVQSPFETSIRVHFTGISFKSFGEVQFQYRIQQLSPDWTETRAREVELRAIPDGNYTFEVRAANADGSWSREPVSVEFSVAPPYWKTGWFRGGIAILVIVAIIFIFRFSVTSAIEEEQEKTERQRQISELQMQALRAQMNPHFIFNSLNSVQHFIATKDEKAALRYLSKFAKLIRMVLENSRHPQIALDKELEALNLYLSLELLRVDHGFEYEIEIDPKLKNAALLVPPMLVQPYVENAIWHGLMPRGDGGSVSIELKLNNDQLQIIIEDNGIGRERSAELNRKKRKYHESIGLHATKERLDLLGMLNEGPTSEVVTEDLYDEDGEPAGTRVTLKLPAWYVNQEAAGEL